MDKFLLNGKHLILVIIILLAACKSGANSNFEKQRASHMKKYGKAKNRKKRMVEKSYKVHMKNQSRPMRKQMKKDRRRMRRDKRRKARRYR